MHEKEKVAEFISNVFKLDELSAVLKSHLYLEQSVDSLIIDYIENTDLILRKSFKIKLDFLYSVGIITKAFRQKLLIINSIRNKFSHQLGYQLSNKDIETISGILVTKIEIPADIEFSYGLENNPKAKESLLFCTAVALLVQYIGVMKERSPEVPLEILHEALDSRLSKNNSGYIN